MQLLGRLTKNWLAEPHALPKGYRFSLGNFLPEEYSLLLREAFEGENLLWEPSDNLVGVPIVRASDGDMIAACSIIRPAFLHQVAVHPAHQKLGIGGAFIRQIAHLFELPYLLVQVDSTTTEAGHRFWNKQGFKEVGS